MLDGKMEDDASLKQCLVIVELAERLARTDPALAELYADNAETSDHAETSDNMGPSVAAASGSTAPTPAQKG